MIFNFFFLRKNKFLKQYQTALRWDKIEEGIWPRWPGRERFYLSACDSSKTRILTSQILKKNAWPNENWLVVLYLQPLSSTNKIFETQLNEDQMTQ